MKTSISSRLLRLLPGLAILAAALPAFSQTTAFNYQGRLTDGGQPATGLYDLTFKVFDSAGPGTAGQQGSTASQVAVPVTNGLFSVSLNFGSAPFSGARRWLEVGARTNNPAASYVTLLPRTELTPVPYAITAQSANAVPAGTVGNAQLAANAVTATKISSGQVVKSLNGLRDDVTLVAGANVTLTPSGNNLTINSSGSGAFSLNGNNAYYNAGNVGIGTISPQDPLHVNGFARVGGTSSRYVWLGQDGSGMFLEQVGDAPMTSNMRIQSSRSGAFSAYSQFVVDPENGFSFRGFGGANGNVGIGTFTPAYTLDVQGEVNAAGAFIASSAYTGAYGTVLSVPHYSRKRLLNSYWRFDLGDYVDIEVPGNDGPGNLLRITSHGNLGVGVSDPRFHLDIGGRVRFRDEAGANTAGAWYQAENGFGAGGLADIAFVGVLDATRVGIYGNDPRGALGWGFTFDTVTGNVGIGTGTSYPTSKLQVNGDMSVSVLTITGGADLAEPFDMSEEDIPKGAVVVIDEDNPGKLKMSDRSYDNRVAGIISGANGVNPGIMLKQEGILEGTQNVALTGRVYALADASASSIKPGDLLTTSGTPGHCMKAADRDQSHGAIIGKAMTGLKEGKGHVLVLVNLQ